MNDQGEVTTEFHEYGESHWRGNVLGRRDPLFLVPLVSNRVPDGRRGSIGIFVNSVPKSGTYFLEAAIGKVGVPQTRWHVGPDAVDDYWGMSDQDLHVNPISVRVRCDTRLVSEILHGCLAVGHVFDPVSIRRFRDRGAVVLSAVRDLRDVTVSMYRFKRDRVAPSAEAGDRLWRALDGQSALAAFLGWAAQRDFALVKRVAEATLEDRDAIVVRYEDLRRGHLSEEAAARLDAKSSGFAGALTGALIETLDRGTSTWSGKPSQWESMWSSDLDTFFTASGLRELNRRLGYER